MKLAIEDVGKSVGVFAAVASAAVTFLYVAGYLALRMQVTALGIPTDLHILDERYLFTGVSLVIYAIFAVADPVVSTITSHPWRFALAAIVSVAVVWLARRSRAGARLTEWRRSLAKRPQRLATLFALIAVIVALGAIASIRPWLDARNIWADADQVFPTPLRALVTSPRYEKDATKYLADAFLRIVVASAALVAAMRLHQSRWHAVALGPVALQWLLLPMFFGVLTLDHPRPKLMSQGDAGSGSGWGWVLWETGDSLLYLSLEPAPAGIRRLQKDAATKWAIVGYERMLQARAVASSATSTKATPRAPAAAPAALPVATPAAPPAAIPEESSPAPKPLPATTAPATTTPGAVRNFLGAPQRPSVLLRSPGAMPDGDVWVQSLSDEAPAFRLLAGRYRSPIFSADGSQVYAVTGDTIVSVPSGNAGETAREIVKVNGLYKLVGVHTAGKPEVLAIVGESTIVIVPLDGRAPARRLDGAPDRALLNELLGTRRSYGGVEVFNDGVQVREPNGYVAWQNVFHAADGASRPLTTCRRFHCDQPSLSADGRLVAYVRHP